MNRRFILTSLLCVPLALSFLSLKAEAKPQWEEQWYPVQDGRENKLYVRFGSENGLRLRQWGNDYKVKVKFTATITYRAQSQGGGEARSTTTEVVTLEPGAYSSEDKKYIQANAELLDITAVIQ